MANKNDIKKGAGCFLAGSAYLILSILGIIIHVLTIVIAFLSGGIISATLSLILPVLAQLYWGFRIWSATGTFFNLYCLALAGYVVLWIVFIIGMLMTES